MRLTYCPLFCCKSITSLTIFSYAQSTNKVDPAIFVNFPKAELPIRFISELNESYTFFDGMERWNEAGKRVLKLKRQGCQLNYGYMIGKTEDYFAIIYPSSCDELYFHNLSTFKADGSLISTIEIMGWDEQENTVNSVISESLEIKVTYREFQQPDTNDDMKGNEKIDTYRISSAGELELIHSTGYSIRYYNSNNEGELVPVKN